MEKVSRKQYEEALSQVEQLLPLVCDGDSADEQCMIAFDRASDVVEEYENANYPSYQPSLGEIIQEAIYECGFTVKQLAQKLNISVRKLNNYINNRSEPSLQEARGLCTELHLSASDVLGIA